MKKKDEENSHNPDTVLFQHSQRGNHLHLVEIFEENNCPKIKCLNSNYFSLAPQSN